jgi:nucleoside-diphosphate-sugar epimerase
MNKIQLENIRQFVDTFALADELDNCSFLVTGSTGLIGSTFIHCLLALNKGIRIIAPVRNLGKAQSMFEGEKVEWVECDLTTFNYASLGSVDYIVHFAAPTTSKFFVEHPVETAHTIYGVSDALLQYAVTNPVKGFVYASSMEVYGSIEGAEVVTEDMQGFLNPLNVRSSYPMTKRMVETLCCLYAQEYGVPVKIARLAQTTGAGIDKNDTRAIADFARRAVNNQDIVLHTEGRSAHPYCYTIDAVSGMLYVLLRGAAGQAYNVANEQTYMSIRSLAEFAKAYLNKNIDVKVDIQEMGYFGTSLLPLSTAKICALGWHPRYSMEDIYRNLADYLKC